MTANQAPESPRLRALQQELAAGSATALDAFWQETVAQGAPLVERLEDDDQHMLVTFLWHAITPVERVAVFPASSLLGTDIADHATAHLPATDLWFKSVRIPRDYRGTYQVAPNDPLTPLTAGTASEWDARTVTWQTDPLNPRTYHMPTDEEVLERAATTASVLELPDAPPQPWIVTNSKQAAGPVEMHRLHSRILGNERRVWVYTTAGDASITPRHLLILFDGWAYRHIIPTPTILDNLRAKQLIPPHVAVLVDSLDSPTRNRELPCYDPFVDFLADELMPWIRQHYPVTEDPAQVTAGGSSFGGLAAAFAALRRPDVFGNVLSQSGGFRWTREGETEYEWLTRQYVDAPLLSIRFSLDIGRFEVATLGTGLNRLVANRHLRDVLRAKGYAVHYAEYSGGHEYVCWQGTLADGLLALVSTDKARRLP